MQELAPGFMNNTNSDVVPLQINWDTVTNPRCVAKYRVSWATISKGKLPCEGNPTSSFISSADRIDIPVPGARSAEIILVKGLACFPWYSVSVQAISHSGKLGKAAVVSRQFSNNAILDP